MIQRGISLKKITIIFLIFFVLLIPFYASCNEAEGIEKILDMAGDLKEYKADAADNLSLDFNNIINYIKETFFYEFKNIFSKTPLLFLLLILFGIKNSTDMEENINKTVSLTLFSATALFTVNIFGDLFLTASQMIEQLSAYIYICIPMLCGLAAGGGMVITGTKSAFIILSSMNVVTFLINCFFIPITQIYFILGVTASLIENDILKVLKNNIKAIIKVSLPALIGIFMSLITIFVSVTKKMDDFSLKSTKLAVGGMIPFLGSTLADSTDVVLNSIGQIKAQMGIASVLAMIYIFLIPILKIISGILVFKLLSVTAGFLSDKKMPEYYGDLADSLSILAGIMSTIAIMVIISVVTMINT